MTAEEALCKIKALLGRGLAPVAIPEVKKILQELADSQKPERQLPLF